MKKRLSLILACILMLSLVAFPVYAADEEAHNPPIIQPRYTYFVNAWAGLKPTGGDWYNVTGGAGSTYATMNIKVTVSLQKFGDSGWEDLAVWTGSGHYNATAGGPRYICTSGTYRTRMYAEIYKEDGTLGETETAWSDHLIIP